MNLFAFLRRHESRPVPARPAGLAGFGQLEDRWSPSTLSLRSALFAPGGGDPGRTVSVGHYGTMTPGGGDPGMR